jgi:hypothetical protein
MYHFSIYLIINNIDCTNRVLTGNYSSLKKKNKKNVKDTNKTKFKRQVYPTLYFVLVDIKCFDSKNLLTLKINYFLLCSIIKE